MAKKVTVNADYQPVPENDPSAAYIFNADDARLEKYQKRAIAEGGRTARHPNPVSVAPAAVVDEGDGTVERVGASRRRS